MDICYHQVNSGWGYPVSKTSWTGDCVFNTVYSKHIRQRVALCLTYINIYIPHTNTISEIFAKRINK